MMTDCRGVMRPSRSAASIIASAMRSFSEPPGLNCSHLQKTSAMSGATRWRNRTSGVPPMRSSMLLTAYAGMKARQLSLRTLADLDDRAGLDWFEAQRLGAGDELVALGAGVDEQLFGLLGLDGVQQRQSDDRRDVDREAVDPVRQRFDRAVDVQPLDRLLVGVDRVHRPAAAHIGPHGPVAVFLRRAAGADDRDAG